MNLVFDLMIDFWHLKSYNNYKVKLWINVLFLLPFLSNDEEALFEMFSGIVFEALIVDVWFNEFGELLIEDEIALGSFLKPGNLVYIE